MAHSMRRVSIYVMGLGTTCKEIKIRSQAYSVSYKHAFADKSQTKAPKPQRSKYLSTENPITFQCDKYCDLVRGKST
jgi:hypothetical protein